VIYCPEDIKKCYDATLEDMRKAFAKTHIFKKCVHDLGRNDDDLAALFFSNMEAYSVS
jgi:hypothetical protein